MDAILDDVIALQQRLNPSQNVYWLIINESVIKDTDKETKLREFYYHFTKNYRYKEGIVLLLN